MSYDDFFMLFGPSLIFVLIGIAFWIVPIKYPDNNYLAPNDISRFYSEHGVSKGFINNFTKAQWNYIKKTAPKVFIVVGVINAGVPILILTIFPLWDKSIICTVDFIVMLLISFFYISKKVDKAN